MGEVARRAYWRAKAWERPATAACRDARREAFVARLRLLARWHRVELDLQVADDVTIGRRVRVELVPETKVSLHLGPGCVLGDDVLILLKGGGVRVGPRCDLRRGCVLNVWGRLELQESNILSWGSTVHCAESVVLEPYAAASEFVTIVDSSHLHTDPDRWFYHDVRAAPVRVGRHTWLATRSVVTRGVTVGSYCVLGANSVITTDVPDGHLASGVPATVRALDHPWLQTGSVTRPA